MVLTAGLQFFCFISTMRIMYPRYVDTDHINNVSPITSLFPAKIFDLILILMFSFSLLQEENEIPTTVFVKDPPPFPRDEILEESEELVLGEDGNRSQEGGLHTIDLSSDEDVGLEAELDDEEPWPHDLENMEKSRAEKIKRSSLKKVRTKDRCSFGEVFRQTGVHLDR